MQTDKHSLHLYIAMTTMLVTPLFFTLTMGNVEARNNAPTGICQNHGGVDCGKIGSTTTGAICADGTNDNRIPHGTVAAFCRRSMKQDQMLTEEPKPKYTQQETQQQLQPSCRQGFKLDTTKRRCIKK